MYYVLHIKLNDYCYIYKLLIIVIYTNYNDILAPLICLNAYGTTLAMFRS